MKLQLIRNATMKLFYKNQCLLMDPYLGEKGSGPSYAGVRKSPVTELPFREEDILKNVDAVILSHVHSDHFDEKAMKLLNKDLPLICPSEEVSFLKENGFNNPVPIESSILWKEIEICRIDGQHGFGEVLEEMGSTCGFMFKAENEPDFYWTGDTIFSEVVKSTIEAYQPKVIATHSCGAQWKWTPILMNDVDTAAIAALAPDSTVVAVHMEAVDHETIDRKQLRNTADIMKVGRDRLLIPADGEIINFESVSHIEN